MEAERLTTALALIGTEVDLAVGPWSDTLLRAVSMMHRDAALFHLSVARSHVQRLSRSSASYIGRRVLAVSSLMQSRKRTCPTASSPAGGIR